MLAIPMFWVGFFKINLITAIKDMPFWSSIRSLVAAPPGQPQTREVGALQKFIICFGIMQALSPPAFAQTQQQQDRLNQVAQYLVTAPLCGHIGMNLDQNLPAKVETAFNEETSSWDIPPEKTKQLVNEALSRQGKILSADLKTAADAAKTATQLQSLSKILIMYGRTCVAASNDTIFSKLITLPKGYNLEAAAIAKADEMLEPGGLASWQTPRIQALGDLMTLAGACRSKIGAARSDALVRQFGRSDIARERNYYSKSFDMGLANPTMLPTLAACNRAIQEKQAKAR